MKNFIQKLKEFLNSDKGKKVILESKSAFATFSALFLGLLVANPLINKLISTDLPTISQLKDVGPVLLDTFYRTCWIMLLSLIGFKKFVNRN